MSGGTFDYIQYRMDQTIDDIEDAIYKNTGNDPDEHYNNYSEETLAKMKAAVWLLKRTLIYVHRIDWLLAGDDGEETFHKRLINDLNNDLNNN